MYRETPAMEPIIAVVEDDFKEIVAQSTQSCGDFGTVERAEAMKSVLAKAIKLAKTTGLNAQELALCFMEACHRTAVIPLQDAWFEHGFHYAEFEFALPGRGGARSTLGRL